MEKQKLIYVESKALFSPSEVSDKAIVFIEDTKEIWTHGTYFICSNVWATPITLTLSGDSTGSVSIDGSGNVTLSVTNKYLDVGRCSNDANSALSPTHKIQAFKEFAPSFSNGFPATNYANAIININTHIQNYDHQLGFSSNKGIYHRTRSAGTWETSWRELLTSTNYTNYHHTFASLTNKPTTISGYGITDSIPIITGGLITTDTDLSTLGMTTTGAKLSVFHLFTGPYPSWLNVPYMNVLMFRSTSDSYGAIGIELAGSHTVLFMGGRNTEASTTNAPNWWYRIKGNSGTTYDLNSILNSINNLDSNYLRKSGGTMTGNITLTTDAAYITDSKTQHLIFGTISPSTTTGVTGVNGMDAVFAGRLTNMVLRTSGNNLWHYNHAKLARYLILDSNNYTNYTINHTKSGINNTGFVGVVNGNNLYYHSELSFARFAPEDNGGATSYELIAELTNYGTGTNTSYVTYGISGFMWSVRNGNCANSSAYSITAIVSVGPYTSFRIRVPVTTHVLVPFIVKYNDKYYLALKKYSSSTGFYFMGQKLNLLTTTIKVNDASLIEEIKGPENETSTALYYYNNGSPQEYLHAGNYNNYALPLSGGTLTGILKSTLTAGSVLGTSPIVFTGNVGSATGINNTYSHLASNLTTHGALLIFLGKAGSLYNGGSIGYWHKGGDGSSSNALTFSLYAADNLMVILGNGNVGINNTSPSYKLTVGGDIYSSGYIRATSGFIKTDSSDSYVLLGGGGHKLLSDLSSAHTHDWSSITSKPSLLGAMANPIFYPYANDIKLGAYISTINNRFYSADLRYTVTTTNLSGDKHLLFDDNYDLRMLMEPGTTATITIEGYNFVYNNGYIILYFYLYSAYPLLFPKSITAVATRLNGTTYTLNRATSIESGNTIAFSIGLEYLTKIEFTIVSLDNAYCGITNIDYYSRRTEDSGRDCAVVTKYNANTLYHNLTAPKYIVTNGTSSLFLKADGSLDSTSYLKVDGSNGTSDGVSALLNKLGTGNAAPQDADYYICQYVGGGTSNTTYWRRPTSYLYSYIKSKLTPADIKALPQAGGTLGSSSASYTLLNVKSSTALLKIMAYSGTNYIESGNSAFDDNVTLKITGYNSNTGNNLYFNFTNIYCRGSNYTNIDSGNYSSYALPLSGGTLTGDIKTSKSIYAASFYESSDIRLKENVSSIDLSDLMKSVDLVLFNFKDNLTKKYGVIAQLLEAAGLNNLVYDNDGNKAVDYISLLVLEMQRLRNEIADLKEKLNNKEQTS